MNPLSAPSPILGTLAATHGSARAQLKGAAQQFEAIFIRQMLAAARKTSFGEDLFGGQGMDTFRQMQDERFADIASQTGAFGLAKQIEAQLARQTGGPADRSA